MSENESLLNKLATYVPKRNDINTTNARLDNTSLNVTSINIQTIILSIILVILITLAFIVHLKD